MSETEYWSPGDHVVLRYVGGDNGWVIGWPQVVVEDNTERVVLYQPAGTSAENVPGVGEDRRSRLDQRQHLQVAQGFSHVQCRQPVAQAEFLDPLACAGVQRQHQRKVARDRCEARQAHGQ